MTVAEVRKLPNGVYRVHWKVGGTSVASLGCLHDGTPWLAPSNWVSRVEAGIAVIDHWRAIAELELIATE